jgi:hypothetical protein
MTSGEVITCGGAAVSCTSILLREHRSEKSGTVSPPDFLALYLRPERAERRQGLLDADSASEWAAVMSQLVLCLRLSTRTFTSSAQQ